MSLHRTHRALLVELFQCGGSGKLDIHGRIVAGSPPHALTENPTGWMTLVAYGMIGGEDGKIILTNHGRETAVTSAETVRDSA